MKIFDYLSRNYFGPLYNTKQGFAEINTQIPRWQEVMSLPRDQAQEIESQRLATTLKSAYQNTRYYREIFDSAGIADNLDDPGILSQIPLLTKDIIRTNTDSMINSALPSDEILKTMTGGSTSDPLP